LPISTRTAGAAAVEAASGDGDVRFTATDVSERLDVHNLVAKTIDAFGSINALVNNAGIVHAADFLDLEEADFDRVLNVNLKSAFLCGQAVARHMVEQIGNGDEPGSIVNMSSINDTFAIANQVPYSVSKGGVSQLDQGHGAVAGTARHPRQCGRAGFDHDRPACFGC
jgi:glucose 1-dehydrogenase